MLKEEYFPKKDLWSKLKDDKSTIQVHLVFFTSLSTLLTLPVGKRRDC